MKLAELKPVLGSWMVLPDFAMPVKNEATPSARSMPVSFVALPGSEPGTLIQPASVGSLVS